MTAQYERQTTRSLKDAYRVQSATIEKLERENADLRQQLAAAEARTVERAAKIADGYSAFFTAADDIAKAIRAILKGKDNEQG